MKMATQMVLSTLTTALYVIATVAPIAEPWQTYATNATYFFVWLGLVAATLLMIARSEQGKVAATVTLPTWFVALTSGIALVVFAMAGWWWFAVAEIYIMCNVMPLYRRRDEMAKADADALERAVERWLA